MTKSGLFDERTWMENAQQIVYSRIWERCEPEKQTGSYIVYWMQQAQRGEDNPALNLAIERSNESGLPLLVLFVFTTVPEANLRHYHFMTKGLWETSQRLSAKGIQIYFLAGDPIRVLPGFFGLALEVITDHGYLRYQRDWRDALKESCLDLGCGWTEVETEALVPIAQVSLKEEYAAATLRPKYLKALSRMSLGNPEPEYRISRVKGFSLSTPHFNPAGKDFDLLMAWVSEQIHPDSSVALCPAYPGGRTAAWSSLQSFIVEKLPHYAEKRNEPSLDIQSGLSPYLHFGQLSSREIVRCLLDRFNLELMDLCKLIKAKPPQFDPLAGIVSFAEELLIRRELSFNFCSYNDDYDSFNCLPSWARQSLINHLADQREQHYSLDRLEQCATDDIFWNTAQREMMETGKMHNYMRMYWGKRLLAWFDSPEDAYQVLLYLNNRYELDGRDPNAFAGVAWCFGKHDRPWQTRPVYGSVRYMNAAGLERKFNMAGYLNKVKAREL